MRSRAVVVRVWEMVGATSLSAFGADRLPQFAHHPAGREPASLFIWDYGGLGRTDLGSIIGAQLSCIGQLDSLLRLGQLVGVSH